MTAAGEGNELAKSTQPAYIVVAKSEHRGVLAAAKDLQRDVTKIAGVTPNIVHELRGATDKCIVIATADCDEGRALLAAVGVPVDDLTGKWESFKYRVVNNVAGKRQVLAIAGSNVRGTIYGVYDFEQKHLGVDPLWFWADHEPPTRGELVFDDRINFGPSKEPTWKYRGWTLNDHPQILEWIQTGLIQRTRYGRYMFPMHPEVITRFCEAALRLKMNMFTWYFIDVDWQPDRDGLQAVVDRGLFITQQQAEGLGANVGYWDTYWQLYNPAGKPPQLSYRKHPEAFREFWSHYIKKWSEFSPQVVWEVNQRGWADAPYTEPSLPEGGTPEQRAQVITEALVDQVRLVRQFDRNPDLQMMTTLYYELGRAFENGSLKLPPGVTASFADQGMNGMVSPAFWNGPRDPERTYGQYFHTQYFGGGPQIAKCTPIDTFLKVNIDAMHKRGDTRIMLLAMNELRLQQLEIRAVAEMLWDYPAFETRAYLQRYTQEEFGAEAGPRVAQLYDEYYAKFPHRMITDEFKTYAFYYKVMEPMFTVIGNLLTIENGNRDGRALRYDFKRDVYEKGIADMGEVLAHAQALRPSIRADRQSFFDYEFIAPTKLVRGIYKLSMATQDAIARLQTGDRAGALAALLEAKPLTEELYAAFKSEMQGDKWKYWFRNSTNKDFYQLYNLYQKARLRLEVETMNSVEVKDPPRRPFLGNVVMHDPTKVGDAIYGSQPERINGSFFNGSRWSLTKFPLENVFQIGGVEIVTGKGDWLEISPPDHGRAYTLELQGRSTVFVACEKGHPLPWLKEHGFTATGKTMEAGFWGWPYRYQNRPPSLRKEFEIFSREYPAGEVKLGTNPAKPRSPYVVFVRPQALLFENFRRTDFGQPPVGWKIAATGGRATVEDVPDYDAEMRPTSFDIATVPRYVPLDLRGMKLACSSSDGLVTAQQAFSTPTNADLVLDFRLKPGQADQRSELALTSADGKSQMAVVFTNAGTVTVRGTQNEAAICGYEADKWYTIKVLVSGARREAIVEVQDDKLKITRSNPIAISGGELSGLTLSHASTRAGSWMIYNALSAYIR